MFLRQQWIVGTLMGTAAALLMRGLIPAVPELSILQVGLVCGGLAGGLLAALAR